MFTLVVVSSPMTSANPDTAALRQRRIDEARAAARAALSGELPEKRIRSLETKADAWARWFRNKMDDGGVGDPLTVLPDALARLEQLNEDHVAAAIRKFKTAMKRAMSS
jgi:hypothetical protein